MSIRSWLKRRRLKEDDFQDELRGYEARAYIVVKIETPQLEVNIRISNADITATLPRATVDAIIAEVANVHE